MEKLQQSSSLVSIKSSRTLPSVGKLRQSERFEGLNENVSISTKKILPFYPGDCDRPSPAADPIRGVSLWQWRSYEHIFRRNRGRDDRDDYMEVTKRKEIWDYGLLTFWKSFDVFITLLLLRQCFQHTVWYRCSDKQQKLNISNNSR